MLSKKAKYAIRALVYLAKRRGSRPCLIRDMAVEERIPKKFLELILLEMKTAGILGSKSGRGGGYYLDRAPESVRLSQVIRLLDGPLAPVPCVSQTAYAPCRDCRDEQQCVIRLVMKQVRDSTARILDRTTLRILVEEDERLSQTGRGIDFQI